ncbi:pyridoxal phosphate-dependent transferase [Aspergillus pseudonomiae]|uniref:Pyridoxal phosphate-dependent transferase n=1 Tax=Aspergillus pseudonomiae TaxID=1506151 RepID=A0A5N7DJE0_9EURO|nr:pyridoxal phosphate-dependent transferase [Aspergillus pseudonomiae]KAB8255989.1 pyridoxal phosphate-dependent transferase [Aspergillus pseudonomiae]KAE8406464.1 pyridoxal phosphate-dependent transferase [Aspergillus pseudonomiae]
MGDAGPPKISNHDLISSYFIGPKSENLKPFSDNIAVILEQLRKTRDSYGKNEVFISDTAQQKLGPVYEKFKEAVEKTAALLGEHSIPFWHPRYQGHMCTDMTMPGLLGYFMTMIYNPNNVAVEASPFTTVVELKVGQQLCEMFGYNIHEEVTHLPLSWGHITCDGTVANLESIWVARNLKFYPLTLYQAMKEGPLGFIANDFQVTTCVGEEKLFKDLGVWELLNLQPDVILDMGDALYRQFGVTSKFLEQALTPFTIQTTGKDVLEREFRITKPAKYFLAQTRHYSWPKGGAIAGIGSANMQGVELDMEGRISLDALERELNRCLEERQAVYAVVAVIGTTEEGGVDRLHEILAMRRRFQDRGLSFLVHADAAWGGYFASMIPRKMMDPNKPSDDNDGNTAVDEVPSLALRQDTLTDMIALKEADTITVDPHKAGYIPYPAGSLCYRDGRMRFLVTWTSPYLTQGSTENIGVYGVEGSKPGAAAMAAWMSNQTIGLSPSGYGRLLGEAAFTSARLSAWYAAMHVDQPGWKEKRPYYIIIPFNPLPIEKEGKDTLSDEVNSRREWILKNVIEKSNDEISKEEEIMNWLRNIGSDLNINAFAINWYDEQGNLNTELEEANYLMRRVVNRLSITTTQGKPEKPSLFLTSTQFEPALYGQCAQNFMRRLGLAPCAQDLWVLRNVVMSPFPTTRDFIRTLMKEELERVIIEEVKHCRTRNSREQKELEFLLRGTDEVFLDFQTSFHRATQRQQIILAATLAEGTMKSYKALKDRFSVQDIVFKSKESQNLEELMTKIKNEADPKTATNQPIKIDGVISAREGDTFIGTPIQCTVEMTRVVISRPLNSANRDDHYPRHFMPFYLYGAEEQYHISHMLLQAPNVNLSASEVKLDKELLKIVRPRLRNHKALILTLTGYREETMHPFPPKNDDPVLLSKDFFFRPGKVFNVKVYEDPKAEDAKGPGLIDNLGTPIARGTMTLRSDVHVDVETLNRDPLETKEEGVRWDAKLDEIKDVFEEGRKMASGMAPQAAV